MKPNILLTDVTEFVFEPHRHIENIGFHSPKSTVGMYFYSTNNGGYNWNSLTPPSFWPIKSVAVSPSNPQKLWIACSPLGFGERVFVSDNGGGSWADFSGTLPNVPVNCILAQNGSNERLYIGTDLGVFYREETMSDGVPSDNGLPNVVINELEISYADNKLWAATYGRGLWAKSLNNPSDISEKTPIKKSLIADPNSITGEGSIVLDKQTNSSGNLCLTITSSYSICTELMQPLKKQLNMTFSYMNKENENMLLDF